MHDRIHPKIRPQIRPVAGIVLGLGLLANGVTMLTTPSQWYHAVPTVDLTGPLNTHFVRDIGCAYAVSGLGLIWAGLQKRLPAETSLRSASLFAALFLLMHAAVHVYEVAAGLCGWRTGLQAAPGVIVPALLAIWAALPGAVSGAFPGAVNKEA